MKKAKIDNSGVAKAEQARAEAQAIANNLQKNFATDLKNENLTTVDAGGDAATMSMDTETARRKKVAGGLSSQLGISV